jgi:glycerophosphoryl diester phosphodiesterase
MFDRSTFLRPTAHRGLHDNARGVIENSEPAFEAAIQRSYGIECDLRAAADGVPVVFHDSTIDRLVDGRGPIDRLSIKAMKKLRYRDIRATRIMTLAEFLELVDGRVPVLLEIKSEWTLPHPLFLRRIANQLKSYKGPAAVMSFDPACIAPFRDLAPATPRGIVSGSYSGAGWWPRKISAKRAAALRDCLEAGIAAPQFFAYEVAALPTPVMQFARTVAGLPVFAWTVRSVDDRAIASYWADAMIFEGFRPKL